MGEHRRAGGETDEVDPATRDYMDELAAELGLPPPGPMTTSERLQWIADAEERAGRRSDQSADG